MTPLLPFITGLAVGAAAISVLRSERTRGALNATGTRLRSAASAAEDSMRAAAQSGLALLHGASTEKPAAQPTKPRRTAKKPAAKTAAKTAAKSAEKAAEKPAAKTAARRKTRTAKAEA